MQRLRRKARGLTSESAAHFGTYKALDPCATIAGEIISRPLYNFLKFRIVTAM